MNNTEKSMLPSLLIFFQDKDHFEILQRYRHGGNKEKYSASILDWFTVNYAKKYGVEYTILKKGRKKIVHVEQSYNAALNAYHKEYFDPFARGTNRGQKIVIENDGEYVETTIRQLNYFRWAIDKGIITYVDTNIDIIYEDMSKRSNRGKKKQSTDKKQLSVSASKSLRVSKINTLLKDNMSYTKNASKEIEGK